MNAIRRRPWRDESGALLHGPAPVLWSASDRTRHDAAYWWTHARELHDAGPQKALRLIAEAAVKRGDDAPTRLDWYGTFPKEANAPLPLLWAQWCEIAPRGISRALRWALLRPLTGLVACPGWPFFRGPHRTAEDVEAEARRVDLRGLRPNRAIPGRDPWTHSRYLEALVLQAGGWRR